MGGNVRLAVLSSSAALIRTSCLQPRPGYSVQQEMTERLDSRVSTCIDPMQSVRAEVRRRILTSGGGGVAAELHQCYHHLLIHSIVDFFFPLLRQLYKVCSICETTFNLLNNTEKEQISSHP